MFIEISDTAMFLVTLNTVLLILGVTVIPFHELKAHYVPILSGAEAAGAVSETTSTTSLTPARTAI